MTKWVLLPLFVLLTEAAISAERFPTDDPTLRPFQTKVATYIDRCENNNISNVERSECLYDQVKALKDIMKGEVAKAKKSNIEAAADKGKYGGDEKATFKALQADFSKSQAAWEKYTSEVCGSVTNRYEILGGTGGAIDGCRCAIRHLVQRINELRG
ncbi:lysozyme inhibitor LprI family protein [Methylobacterium bullatum]|uniref:lysozyme inhibitor LprI family protein n=1 Tax=Methylobacterium bullatum TaxID=570505 RepID=UPI001785951B|nr:lysozyme inhibitor LprI family protein [Methylobacterium bullatum]